MAHINPNGSLSDTLYCTVDSLYCTVTVESLCVSLNRYKTVVTLMLPCCVCQPPRKQREVCPAA